MNQELKDYLRGKIDRAEMWSSCCNEEDRKFYQGQIVAYRNVYKEFDGKQCNITDVVVPFCVCDCEYPIIRQDLTEYCSICQKEVK